MTRDLFASPAENAGAAFPGLLTPAQAAARLGVCTRHLRGLVADGSLRYIDVGRGKVKIRRMFDPADLAAYVEQRRKWAVPPPEGRERQGRVKCRSRNGLDRPSGTAASSSKVVAFSDLLERAAAARPRR